MSFTTVTFFLFVCLVFTLHFVIRRKTWQNLVIIAASYSFYAWWDYRFCALMLISSLVDYIVGRALARTAPTHARRGLLAISLVCNLGLLGFFKYFNFFTDSLTTLLQSMGIETGLSTLRIILPVGISFYTFQTMSYTLDIYARRLSPQRDFPAYMAFVSFFPQLVAGPIERAGDLLPQFTQVRRFDYAQASEGCRLIVWGMFKKMILADHLGVIVDEIYGTPEQFGGPAFLVATACFAFQIYCDFSAYSDIAVGTARIFGIQLMRNFAYPYFSQSISEFWRRWHISLSTWFRDYLYIPLGGSHCSMTRRIVNIMITFVISGLWHGASWTFVIWGALNGLGMIPDTLLAKRTNRSRVTPTSEPGGPFLIPRPGTLLRMVSTFGIICLAWVFFRSDSLAQSIYILDRIAADIARVSRYRAAIGMMNHYSNTFLILCTFVVIEWCNRRHWHPMRLGSLRDTMIGLLIMLSGWVMLLWGTDKALVALAVTVVPAMILLRKFGEDASRFGILTRVLRWSVLTLLFWFIMHHGTHSTGPFIYFQF